MSDRIGDVVKNAVHEERDSLSVRTAEVFLGQIVTEALVFLSIAMPTRYGDGNSLNRHTSERNE